MCFHQNNKANCRSMNRGCNRNSGFLYAVCQKRITLFQHGMQSDNLNSTEIFSLTMSEIIRPGFSLMEKIIDCADSIQETKKHFLNAETWLKILQPVLQLFFIFNHFDFRITNIWLRNEEGDCASIPLNKESASTKNHIESDWKKPVSTNREKMNTVKT